MSGKKSDTTPTSTQPVPVTRTLSDPAAGVGPKNPVSVTQAPGHQPSTRAEPQDGGPEPTHESGPTEVDEAVQSAYAASQDGPTLAADLLKRGLILAVVTGPDLTALAAETARFPKRVFPELEVGELAVVDRFGDVHELHLDATELAQVRARADANGSAPSIASAQGTFASKYAPTAAKQKADAARVKVGTLRNVIVAASQGDSRAIASALNQLTDLVENAIPAPTAGDHIREAMAAAASGKTAAANTALIHANSAVLASPPSDTKDTAATALAAASKALANGDRSGAMDLSRQALEAVEPPASA